MTKQTSKKTEKQKEENSELNSFLKEIERLPEEFKNKLLEKEKKFKDFIDIIIKKSNNKDMGFFIKPEIKVENNVPIPNFENLTLFFLLDDFEANIPSFEPKILLGNDFDKYLIEKLPKTQEDEVEYFLKADKNIKFVGTSISILRENCFDSNYEDLKNLGSSFVYRDSRGFISALKTIDIHRNMLLQKFEKYVVAYVGAGSWLRGEKSNDFDIFLVIDDTDVKRMSRMQVKDQLTKIIWQMSHEVAELTGIQIHIQVYLLTDFWDALKDAHPVMFTFLRDGVPFYDRGIYNAWKELLKLGKIRPSAEAIDMHMNVGNQLLTRAKSIFNEVLSNDIYNAVLSPSQAILMLKGYNPTTPKETVKMFKEVLLAKEKSISKKDAEILENTVSTFKKIEHNKDFKLNGNQIDKFIKDAEGYLENIKKMFEEITEKRTTESIVSSYNELVNQTKILLNTKLENEKEIFALFEKEYLKTGKLPSFIKNSLKSIIKAKEDFKKGKITGMEVNKVMKEVRNVLTEIKIYSEKSLLSNINKKKLELFYAEDKKIEILNYGDVIYLVDLLNNKIYQLENNKFIESKITKEELLDDSKLQKLLINDKLLTSIKNLYNSKEIFF